MADKNKKKSDDDVLDPDAIDALTDDVDTEEEETDEWSDGGVAEDEEDF